MGTVCDLTGQRFGRLTVVSLLPKNEWRRKGKETTWLCQCDCGQEHIVIGYDLTGGKTKSCGCLKREQARERMKTDDVYTKKPMDLTGKKFNMLRAMYIVPKSEHKKNRIVWRCLCDCGRECDVDCNNLVSGHTKSCGCLRGHTTDRKKLFHQVTGKYYPKSHRVIFLDGNSENIAEENMMAVSKFAYKQMQRYRLFFDNAELTKTAALSCELSHQLRKKIGE